MVRSVRHRGEQCLSVVYQFAALSKPFAGVCLNANLVLTTNLRRESVATFQPQVPLRYLRIFGWGRGGDEKPL